MILKVSFVLAFFMTQVNCLSPPPPFTFAYTIDVTGSMSSEIKAVKDAIENATSLLEHFRSFGIDHFVLVTFSDPDSKKTVTNFTSISALHSKISKLTVSGGGDCAEFGLGGLELAIRNSRPNSYIFYFSDASVKDHSKEKEVIRQAKKKGIRIWIMATGTCCTGSCTGYHLYRRVANETGGVYFPIKSESYELKRILLYVERAVLCRNLNALKRPPTSVYYMSMPYCHPTTIFPPVPTPPIIGGGNGMTCSSIITVLMVALVSVMFG